MEVTVLLKSKDFSIKVSTTFFRENFTERK